MPSDRMVRHVATFNAAVVSGDWGPLVTTLAPDATMTFDGPPIGPFMGRDAIAEAYAINPPTDTMTVVEAGSGSGDASTDPGTEEVHFTWSAGGGGSLVVTWSGGLVTGLAIRFA